MSDRLVECVPNFSEGRDMKKIEQILDAVREVEGVSILDVDAGAETNRTVVTLLGSPEAIAEGAFRAIERAADVIDMRKHTGAHPRHGATDVCPFVPVSGVSMDDCVEIAKQVGRRVGEELRIPVWLYDRAAQVPERRSLAKVRAGEYEALPDKLDRPEWKPDYGPAVFNAKSGVVTIGAREFLIAYNVNLNSTRKQHADEIAGEIREIGRAVRRDQKNAFYSSGTLVKYQPGKSIWPCGYCEGVFKSLAELAAHSSDEHDLDIHEELEFFGRDPDELEGKNVMRRGTFTECRGVGWVIPEYNRAQISINLTNFKVTPAHAVLEECRRLARERGLQVTGSEIVGMVPFAALRESGDYYLLQQGSSRGVPVGDVVETAVQSMGLRDVAAFEPEKAVLGLPSTDGALASMKLNEFADEVSRSSPAPGGGSIAALAGSLAASLGAMVANLTHGKKGMEDRREEMEQLAMACQQLKDDLLRAVDADTDAFNDVLAAMRLPRATAEERAAREQAIQDGYKLATDVPYRTAELSLATMRLCRVAAEKGNPASVTDAGVGTLMGRVGVLGAIYNVQINLGAITDAAWVATRRSGLGALREESETLERETREIVEASFD